MMIKFSHTFVTNRTVFGPGKKDRKMQGTLHKKGRSLKSFGYHCNHNQKNLQNIYLIGRLTRQVVQNIFGSKGFFSEDRSANSMMARYLWSSVC